MKKLIYILVLVVVVSVSFFVYYRSNESDIYDYVVAEKGSVVQEVSVTGKVKPVSSVSLAFDRTGKITKFNFDVGDHVVAGDILVTIDNTELYSTLNESLASLRASEARLLEIKKGAKEEEIIVSQARVSGADNSVRDSKIGLVNFIKDSYTKADDSIRNKIDKFFSNPRSANPSVNFVITDTVLGYEIEFNRFVVEERLKKWATSIGNLSLESDLSVALFEAKDNLSLIKGFLDKVSLAVNSLVPTSELSQATIDSYKSDTSTARTNINASILSLASADEKLSTAESSLLIAQKELALKLSGSTPEQIKAQEANVEQAKARADNIRSQINKTILKSPISGVVTRRNYEVGEIVAINSSVISVISDLSLEIEANVSEADIAKVKIGDIARVTLDAYGEEINFPATVAKVDPAELVIEGIATYKVSFRLIDNDNRIKSGMTANIDILTNKKDNVLTISQRSTFTREQTRYVLVKGVDGVPAERAVVVGLRGSDGLFEVISGISEGDFVLAFPN